MIKQWGKPIIIFHILLVISVFVLFTTGDNEDVVNIHEIIGYFVILLIISRFYYSSITKNKYEQISSWIHSKKDLINFFRTFFTHKETKFHNPASSIVMMVLLFLLTLSTISGAIALAGTESMGYLSYFVEINYKSGKLFENIHSSITDILLFFIAIHIIGSIISSIISKTNLVKSIFIFNTKPKE